MTKKQWIMEIEHLLKKDETNNLLVLSTLLSQTAKSSL